MSALLTMEGWQFLVIPVKNEINMQQSRQLSYSQVKHPPIDLPASFYKDDKHVVQQ